MLKHGQVTHGLNLFLLMRNLRVIPVNELNFFGELFAMTWSTFYISNKNLICN